MATTSPPSTTALSDSQLFLDDDQLEPQRGSSLRWIGWMIVLLALLGGGLYGAQRYSRQPAATREVDGSLLYDVQPTDLVVTVTEDGNVESANNVDVKCKVAGGSTILWIIPDGTEVKSGDKIVELDASALEDQINTQKIAYNKAKSTLVTAETNVEVAKLSVREYLEGTYKKELETADTQITIAEENLRSSKNSLEYAERMFQRGYISELELESQEFTVKRAELELSAANTSKTVLMEFTKVKTLEDLQSKVSTAESTLESERAAFELEEAKLKRLETQLVNCTITAPQSGMVVYANEQGGGRFGGQQSVTIEEGAAVRDRQTLLRLPDLNKMQVKVKVHETKVEQLAIGMRARINIQGRIYQGSVTSIANQHEATSFFSGNVKEYATTVRIDGEVDSLRPGMTAEVEILVSHLKGVLTIPVSAIVEQRGQFLSWVQTRPGEFDRRPLVLGMSDDNFVEVKDGLKPGDKLVRNPRAMVEEAREFVDEEEAVDVKEEFGAAAGGAGSGSGGPPGAGAGPPTGQGPRGPVSGGPVSGGPVSGGPNANGQPGAPVEGGGPNLGPDGGGPEGGPAREERGPGGPDGGGRGGRGPGRGGPSGNLMDADTDGDGKVSRDEAPEPMQNFFDRIDENSDGFIDKAEADALRQRFMRGGPPGGGPPGDGAPGGGPPGSGA